MNSTTTTHESFLAACKSGGVQIDRLDPKAGFISLAKRFTPGDNAAYAEAESATSVVYDVPARGGSTWGTTGDGIGGMVAVNNGRMVINRTGCSKRFLAALAKLVAASA